MYFSKAVIKNCSKIAIFHCLSQTNTESRCFAKIMFEIESSADGCSTLIT